jgi:hypothetical protein
MINVFLEGAVHGNSALSQAILIVTVIKTLALHILVQCLTVLPNPPDSVLNDIDEIFINFYGMVKRTRSRDLLYQGD